MFHYDLSFCDGCTIGIDIFSMPILDSRMYIFHVNHDELLIIDPVLLEKEDEPALRAICSSAKHATVLITHSHYDHIAGLNYLRKLLPVTLYATQLCNSKLQDSHRNLSAYSMALVMGKDPNLEWYCETHFDFDYTCSADEIYDTATELAFNLASHMSSSTESNGGQTTTSDVSSDAEGHMDHDGLKKMLSIRTIPSPGHSDCSQCIELRICDCEPNGTSDHNSSEAISLSSTNSSGRLLAVFTGDSLVNGHDTITRFPTGNKRVFREETEPYLMSLPDDMIILPGHGDPARLSEIKEYAIL